MCEILWCIFTLVSLDQLNGSAGYQHFYVTSHPNMIEYLENMQPEKTETTRPPPLGLFCKMLKESRIFKAVDPVAKNFKMLDSDWGSLLNFNDPSLEMYSLIDRINTDIKKEIEKLGNDRQYGYQIGCFKSPKYEYFLLFNWGRNIPDYDKLLLVRHMRSKEVAILGLVQMHDHGTTRTPEACNVAPGSTLERSYLGGIKGKNLTLSEKPIEKKTFCSLTKYHLLNYCSRALNLFWDLVDRYKDTFPDMASASPVNYVEVGNCKCIDGKVNLPTQRQKTVNTVFLPCTIKHKGSSLTEFHLTPSGGLFVAKNTGDGDNYMLHGHIYDMDVVVKNVGLKSEVEESIDEMEALTIY